MSRTKPVLALTLILVLAPAARPADGDKPKLTESDVLKLIEIQIDDTCIIARSQQGGGPGFDVDDAVIGRLKKAGASDAVLAQLRGRTADGENLPDDPARARLAVWAKRYYDHECPLQSE